jgi:hypothetical protein
MRSRAPTIEARFALRRARKYQWISGRCDESISTTATCAGGTRHRVGDEPRVGGAGRALIDRSLVGYFAAIERRITGRILARLTQRELAGLARACAPSCLRSQATRRTSLASSAHVGVPALANIVAHA